MPPVQQNMADPPGEPPDIVMYRPTLRWAYWLVIVAYPVVALAIIYSGASGGQPLAGVALALMMGGCVLMAWRMGLHPYVRLGTSAVEVRRPLGAARSIPYAEIRSCSGGYSGTVVALADGTHVVAPAVQKANISVWMHKNNTRADRLCQDVMRRAEAARTSQNQP
jgi:hypothetical protein